MVNSTHSDTPKKDRKTLTMSNRSRPRAHQKDDSDAQHEEAHIWSRIVPELKALAVSSNLANAQAEKIKKEEERLFGREGDEVSASMNELNALRELENKQLEQVNKEQAQLQSLIDRVAVLAALREATEGGDRETKQQRKKRTAVGDNDSIRGDRDSIGGSSRDGDRGGGDRGGPGGLGRNKMARSMSASAPAQALGDARSDSIQLRSEVAYRLPKQKGNPSEVEWIQCNVINIIGEGPKRRYEVQDPEPDELGGHGKIYKTTAKDLIPIPKESVGLPVFPVGKHVLARYPETTTFYKAEVMGTKRDGTCRLKFEGEEEVNKEQEVERRLVLDTGGK